MPTLRKIGLFGDSTSGHFREMFDVMHIALPSDRPGAPGPNPLDRLVEVPEDLESWATGAG